MKLGLYLHFPYCVAKCPYCDFNSYQLKEDNQISSYIPALYQEIIAYSKKLKNINIDIMFALPEQTTEDLQATLKKAVSLKPDHLSLYNLTLKPGTEYYKEDKRGKLKLPTEDEEFDMYNWAINYLEENGFEHYEIANFARPHKRSEHNLIYWQNKPYLGIGAGAFSFIRGYRYMNYENPARYIKEIMGGKLPIDNGEKLSLRKRMIETIILGLRTNDGISCKEFAKRFKVDIYNTFYKQIKKLVNTGLLQKDDCKIKLTRRGIFLADTVFREFVD